MLWGPAEPSATVRTASCASCPASAFCRARSASMRWCSFWCRRATYRFHRFDRTRRVTVTAWRVLCGTNGGAPAGLSSTSRPRSSLASRHSLSGRSAG
jgi:hypothetical protein